MRLSTYLILAIVGVLAAAMAHADGGNYGDYEEGNQPGVSAPYPQQPPAYPPPQMADGCVNTGCVADSGPIYQPRVAGVCFVRPAGPNYLEILAEDGRPLIGGNWSQIQGYIRHYLTIGVCRSIAQ